MQGQDTMTVTLGARVTREAAEALRALARARGEHPSDTLRRAIARELEWVAPGLVVGDHSEETEAKA